MKELEKMQKEAILLKTKEMLRGLTGAFEKGYRVVSLGGENFFELKLKDKATSDMLLRVVKRAGLHTLPESGQSPDLLRAITEKGLEIAIIDVGQRLVYLPYTEENRELTEKIYGTQGPELARTHRQPRPQKAKSPGSDLKKMRIKGMQRAEATAPVESENIKRIRETLRRRIGGSNVKYNREKDVLILIITTGIPFKNLEAMGYPLTEGPAEGGRRTYYVLEDGERLAAIQRTGDSCHWITFQKAKGHRGFIKEFLGKLKPQ